MICLLEFPRRRKIRDVRLAESSWMIYLRDEGLTLRGSRVREVADGLNNVEVSKGVLDYLDTRHHLDEGQFFTTIPTMAVKYTHTYTHIRK